ncbi:MAG: 4Fe-4S dicluster domain-containing protein [Alphaproteobacteria bacterium]|nr:4Fe-4S dicluster domain-containing protein [Alphaproteobacteria bacterium]MBT4082623.1 4Fe-4S dicluster domain-containing protein [Alphaproteobacteria bacterium]MBT4545885.1 4Fe-4S dicluster domain-containing protein [Alphaproteobacteria bacterium]MBT5919219.1 4Fe-4S dicluster domain-containing protein [Alphaproteobacteria bacterium]MBT7746390.1 4Fe-4S dicluster domain-containing protein [Alphaproteobacteria bacterium]
MATVAHLSRPQRWDSPYDPEMLDSDVQDLLTRPEISAIDAGSFPDSLPLEGILKNDTRLVRFNPGDIVVREGDYGNSAFVILKGKLRVFTGDYPAALLGRETASKKGLFETIAQVWTNNRTPEVRDTSRYGDQAVRASKRGGRSRRLDSGSSVFVQDIPVVLNKYKTAEMSEGALFGELAALGRIPRTATIFAEDSATLLEIRWQGLREIRRFDDGFRRMIDNRYRQNALLVHLRETELFANLDEEALDKVAQATLFETYGAFDWHVSYQKMRSSGQSSAGNEPPIARQGEYVDGLLMIRAGFARVAREYGTGQRTLTYLGAGDNFGLEELYEGWKAGETVNMSSSLTALGYVDALRVPAQVLEEHVFPHLDEGMIKPAEKTERTLADDALLEFAVEERFINATQAMLIDLDRCVRCDDCVRACASTHGGNPRFLRHGKTFDHWMVTNACMHCTDPVCMIGCPTGAIHRSQVGGSVVINDDTCIGCATCATSCPYDNIRMVEIRSADSHIVVDPATSQPILKATKCDLCYTNPGGPACVRACPHDALNRVDFHFESITEGDL